MSGVQSSLPYGRAESAAGNSASRPAVPGARGAPNAAMAGRSGGARPVRVLLAEAAPLFRRGLHTALHPEADIRIVGEAGDSREAVGLARTLAPDVVLLDAGLPGFEAEGSGWAATRALLPRLRICLLLSDEQAGGVAVAQVLRQLTTSADGYLARRMPVEDLAPAIRSVAMGQPVLSPLLAATLMPSLLSLTTGESGGAPAAADAQAGVGADESGMAAAPSDLHGLTGREVQVLALMARGLPNREIASRLFISENTVRNHVRHILDKLHLRTRTEAAMYAVRARVIEMPEVAAGSGAR